VGTSASVGHVEGEQLVERGAEIVAKIDGD
jgi:hypothetical protein